MADIKKTAPQDKNVPEVAKIKSCSCNHEWQDATYGKGMRVQNSCGNKGSNKGKYRCTVCGKLN